MAVPTYTGLSADNVAMREFTITLSDTDKVGAGVFKGPYKLYVTTGGNVVGKFLKTDGTLSDTARTITVPDGALIETICFSVITTATTATGLVALFP